MTDHVGPDDPQGEKRTQPPIIKPNGNGKDAHAPTKYIDDPWAAYWYMDNIPISRLTVLFPDAQRPFRPKRALAISQRFDWRSFQPPAVMLPNDAGIYHIIDGQTRIGAARLKFPDAVDLRICCQVIKSHDPHEAAAIWHEMNNSRNKPTPYDIYDKGVYGGMREYVAIENVLRDLGVRVAANLGKNNIQCVSKLMQVAKKHGPDVLSLSLSTIKEIWPDQPDRFQTTVVGAMCDFMGEHSEHINHKGFVAKVAKAYPFAGRLVATARALKDPRASSAQSSVERELVRAYNTGRRRDRIEE